MNESVISCRKCCKIMTKYSRDICDECHQNEEQLFILAKGFLEANPGSSPLELSRALKIDLKLIDYFVESGRFDRFGIKLLRQCQTCNQVISTGVICDECSKNIQKQVVALKKGIEEAEEAKRVDTFHERQKDRNKGPKGPKRKGGFHRLADD